MSSGSLVATTQRSPARLREQLQREDPPGLDDPRRNQPEHVPIDDPVREVDDLDPELEAERADQRRLVHQPEVHERPSEPAAATALPVQARAQGAPVDGASLHEDLSDGNPLHSIRPARLGRLDKRLTHTLARTCTDMQVPLLGYFLGGAFFLEFLDISVRRALAFFAAVVFG